GTRTAFLTTRHVKRTPTRLQPLGLTGIINTTFSSYRPGMPLIIHNMGQKQRENDYFAFRKHMAVTGHYRFDASHIPPSVVKPWSGPLPR
ncbi:DUF1287 domain-containing protein, partial [Bifidobacterium boum]|uniref:DUF1287 domain-containing protein n=1 Tax=Bifidobacterium boum TaxID=78343 RepID=UPI003F914AEE